MKKTYAEKLLDPRWQKKRLEILNRDNFKCTLCGDKETELHVHHEEYSGDPWEAPVDKLKTLCKHCHKVVEYHKSIGAPILSQKYLRPNDRILVETVFLNNDGSVFISVDIIDDEGIQAVVCIEYNNMKDMLALMDKAKSMI
jgi:5-methylcytosine-specific restriction endonuclease McrA